MAGSTCIVDERVSLLAGRLQSDWGVAFDELDQGARVLPTEEGKADAAIEGAGDGCASRREVLEKAIAIAPTESLSCGGTSLVALLADVFDLRLPWVPTRSDAFAAAFDSDRWIAAAAAIDEIRRGLAQAGIAPDHPSYLRTLARGIFDQLMPFEQMRQGTINPHAAVFKLYAAYRAAGLEASFVVLPVDPLGKSTPIHAALSVATDDGAAVVVDPAYEAFDLQGIPAIPIDLTQALAISYARRGLESPAPQGDLAIARELDPFNAAIALWQTLAGDAADDPLRAVRESERFFLGLAREAVRTAR